MITKFINTFRTIATLQLVIVQLLIMLITGLILWFSINPGMDAYTVVAVTLIIVAVIEVILARYVIKILTRPLQIITQAILHVSNEVSDTPPPNVNDRGSEQSGLKALVQTVYQLAVNVPDATVLQKAADQQTGFALPLLQQLPMGVAVFDRSEQLLFANTLGQKLFGKGEEGRKLQIKDLHLLFRGPQEINGWLADCRANKIQDTHTWQRISNKASSQDDRQIFDVIAHYNKHESHDIETTLVAIDRTAEYSQSDEAMDFIALAAHELRGPITVIRGYLDVLQEELGTQLQDDQRMLMERLDVSAGQLSGYINNILNVARYDQNHLKLHLREEAWPTLIQNFLPDLNLRAHAHNRKIIVHVADDLPTVAADASSVQEVVTNLVDNAIKYSHDGGEITIQARADGEFVETTVQDTGIGIPDAVVGRLFTKFYRSHRSKQAVNGTGLGLYLCKAIVESHGGSIWVRSTEGQGSTFGFRLPTYASVASKLQSDDNSNQEIIRGSHGWIKNHAYIRR